MRREVPFAARDPVFDRLERQMDDLLERFMRRPSPSLYSRTWTPRLDIYETGDAFVALCELAGVDPGDVTIEIEGEIVTLRGQRVPPIAPQGSDCQQLEVPFGEFERTIVLPWPVVASRSSADFKDGMLTVILPKAK